MSAPVFLADPAVLDVYVPGSRYVLEGVEARHAGVVQRRRPGERVDVVDGRGVRLECRIAAVDPGRLSLEVVGRRDEPAPLVRLILVQALAKGDRDEMAVEAATEVGVDEVVPWQAARPSRCGARWVPSAPGCHPRRPASRSRRRRCHPRGRPPPGLSRRGRPPMAGRPPPGDGPRPRAAPGRRRRLPQRPGPAPRALRCRQPRRQPAGGPGETAWWPPARWIATVRELSLIHISEPTR